MKRTQPTLSAECITIAFLLVLNLALASCASLHGNLPLKNSGIKVGAPAPDFTYPDKNGRWVSLSDFRGKKVYVFSWSTWCRCKEQLPALQKFYQQYKSDKFEIVAVASDSQGFKWAQQYADRAGVTFVVLADQDNELATKYNFVATENGFLVDEAGIVRMSVINFDIRNQAQKDELAKLMNTDFGAQPQPVPKKPLAQRISEGETQLARHPGNFPIRLELAELYRQQGNLARAESTLRDAVKKNPGSAEAHYHLGVVLYSEGRHDEGASEWETASHLAPANYLYLRNAQSYRDPQRFYAELLKK
jgi:peroxiredoxin